VERLPESLKAETRRPKAEGRPKSEFRTRSD
jgi:hypothetical protein